MIICVNSFGVFAVYILAEIIVVYKSKNRELLKNVDKISFVQSHVDRRDISNLLMDNNKNKLN
jgi:hypothetical protein